jgi:hypothetical protein
MDSIVPPSPRAIHLSEADFQRLTFGSPQGRNTKPSIRNSEISGSETPARDGCVCDTLMMAESSSPVNEAQELVQQTPSISRHRSATKTSMLLIARPTQPWNVDASYDEGRLLHHFLSYVARAMIPLDDDFNPWKTVYPSLAVQDTASSGSQALYHAPSGPVCVPLSQSKRPSSGLPGQKLVQFATMGSRCTSSVRFWWRRQSTTPRFLQLSIRSF